jgi:hypothetical protein
VVVAVVCSVMGVLLFLVGLAAGAIVVHCCGRNRRLHPPLPAEPLYEEVDITTTHRHTRQQELKLEENVAYGHFNTVAT